MRSFQQQTSSTKYFSTLESMSQGKGNMSAYWTKKISGPCREQLASAKLSVILHSGPSGGLCLTVLSPL